MSNLLVTLIQSDLVWQNPAKNLALLEEKIHSIEGRAEIVVLPEMFSTGFSMQPELFAETMEGASVAWMRRVASEKRIILTGSLIIKEYDQYYNRLIWMLPNGQCGYYNKRHLFGYAGEDQQYTAGEKRLVATVKGWRVLLLICYDLRFPVWSRQTPAAAVEEGTGAAEYDAIIYVANWPERRSHAWRTLLQARAIENQCYVMGVNRIGNDGHEVAHSGDSMVVDPLGSIVFDAGHTSCIQTVELQSAHLDRIRIQLPFLKDADGFELKK